MIKDVLVKFAGAGINICFALFLFAIFPEQMCLPCRDALLLWCSAALQSKQMKVPGKVCTLLA